MMIITSSQRSNRYILGILMIIALVSVHYTTTVMAQTMEYADIDCEDETLYRLCFDHTVPRASWEQTFSIDDGNYTIYFVPQEFSSNFNLTVSNTFYSKTFSDSNYPYVYEVGTQHVRGGLTLIVQISDIDNYSAYKLVIAYGEGHPALESSDPSFLSHDDDKWWTSTWFIVVVIIVIAGIPIQIWYRRTFFD